ncbi:hypothetical protein K435DRAFT_870956 [Dendrothele bispora CBS 962.96]|uniref:Uncharacterized protein n=1 Tax=Dendrothele bispora (strain CBS 962.96) TaxID=1314807 RepID=A0A4S8L5R9_DENBC|nr:hypothetical protein K435DRAFT_870956 [Dendrothele bispora CBS 962.96]
MHHFLSTPLRLIAAIFGYVAFAGTTLLCLLTIYNKVQAALDSRDEHVAALVLVETRRSRKLSIMILTGLLCYYAQLEYLRAAAWVAFLVLLSSVITAICDRIDPDDFHTIRPLLFIFLHSVPGLSMRIVLLAEMVRASGNVIMVVCQMVVFLVLGLLLCFLKRPERREEDESQSTEEARTTVP